MKRLCFLIDHCFAHPPEDELVTTDGKIKAMFLPANTTSLIQPMDQGVIATFKKNYRRGVTKQSIAS